MEGRSVTVADSRVNRDVVVFHVWKSLPYGIRLSVSLIAILAGFGMQAIAVYYGLNSIVAFGAGAPMIFIGNIFLLVKGFDSRVDMKRFDPSATWEVVKREKLTELKQLDKKITKWDQSAMDVTSAMGAILLLFIIVAVAAGTWFAPGALKVLVLDAALLIVPHWLTGTRRILRLPKLLVKVGAMEKLLSSAGDLIKDQDLEILMLLKGRDKKIPDDVKFRISFRGQDPDFLGMYGQVVTNDVQGTSYPYFYTVMVAKKGYGLDEIFNQYQPPGKVTKEFDTQEEVEFIVVRQRTTAASGYHTNGPAAEAIFREGFGLAAKAAKG